MREGVARAVEQDELRQVLSNNAYSYLKDGESVASVIEKLTNLNNNADHPLEQEIVEEIIKEKSKTKQTKENKVAYIASFPELVDLVLDEGRVKFLKFSGELEEEVTIDDKTYLAPPKEGIDWLLPQADKVLDEAKKHTVIDTSDTSASLRGCVYCEEVLYPEIYNYFKQFSDLPTEYHYDFLTLTAFHSHLIEKFNFSPIVFLVAAKDRGKTPTLKALSAVSRRGIFTETFREPNLIRWSSDYGASLFFDVRNFPHKVEKSQCEDLIYGRAERGVTSARVLFPEKGAFRDMVTFSVFGVTGATSNKMVDEITEARCVVFHMPYSNKVFNIEATKDRGLPLKEKLTAMRMAHLNTLFVDVQKTRPGKVENYLRGYQQMCQTIIPTIEANLLIFKENLLNQKAEEAESTLEGKLLIIIDGLSTYVEKGTLVLTYDYIDVKINEGRPERFRISNDSLGRELMGMGFKLKRNSTGDKRGIYYDVDLLKKLMDQAGLKSHISDTPEHATNVTEVSENDINLYQGSDND